MQLADVKYLGLFAVKRLPQTILKTQGILPSSHLPNVPSF